MQSFQLSGYNLQQHQQKMSESMVPPQSSKLRNDKQEIEEFYLSKIREYILCTSRIARLDSKAEFLRNALTKDSAVHSNVLSKAMVPKRKRIGRMNISGRPKLFGGSLEEYLEATGEDIPIILRSCIRVIKLRSATSRSGLSGAKIRWLKSMTHQTSTPSPVSSSCICVSCANLCSQPSTSITSSRSLNTSRSRKW